MINHLRSLLVNSASTESAELEEFISPDFTGVSLVASELAIQRHLVPTFFPRRTRNVLASVLTNVASGHKLYDSILGLDPRELVINSLDSTNLYPRASVTGFGEFASVEFSGEIFPRPDIGFFSARWRVFKQDDTSVQIVNLDTGLVEIATIDFSGDISQPVFIGDSGIQFRIVGAAAVPVFEINASFTYPVSFDSISTINHMRSDPLIQEIFAIKDKTVSASLNKDFYFSDNSNTSIGAILIAYALHISERAFQ